MGSALSEYLGPDEKIELNTRQHIFVIVDDVLRIVAVLIVVAALFWAVGRTDALDNVVGDWMERLLVALAAIAALRAIWTIIVWHHERLLVTTSKVVHTHGVLNRDVTGTPLVKIDEVTLRQSLIGRMLKFGRLEVENAAGGTEPLHGLRYIPHPAAVYQLVTRRAREQRMLEGGAHVPTSATEVSD